MSSDESPGPIARLRRLVVPEPDVSDMVKLHKPCPSCGCREYYRDGEGAFGVYVCRYCRFTEEMKNAG